MTVSGLSGQLTADGHELVQRVYFEDTTFQAASTMHVTCISWNEGARTT
jgi:hypothetical protein